MRGVGTGQLADVDQLLALSQEAGLEPAPFVVLNDRGAKAAIHVRSINFLASHVYLVPVDARHNVSVASPAAAVAVAAADLVAAIPFDYFSE